MTTNQFISVRETAQILGVTEKKVMELIEERKLKGYRIADKFLRFKKTDVLDLSRSSDILKDDIQPIISYTQAERIQDFLYFNDFYLICGAIIIILLYVIFYT